MGALGNNKCITSVFAKLYSSGSLTESEKHTIYLQTYGLLGKYFMTVWRSVALFLMTGTIIT